MDGSTTAEDKTRQPPSDDGMSVSLLHYSVSDVWDSECINGSVSIVFPIIVMLAVRYRSGPGDGAETAEA